MKMEEAKKTDAPADFNSIARKKNLRISVSPWLKLLLP